jgi:hypothetical protein
MSENCQSAATAVFDSRFQSYSAPLSLKSDQGSAKAERILTRRNYPPRTPTLKIAPLSGRILVPRGGLEPPCGYPRWILSPLRLPFRHLGYQKKKHRLAGRPDSHPSPQVTVNPARSFGLITSTRGTEKSPSLAVRPNHGGATIPWEVRVRVRQGYCAEFRSFPSRSWGRELRASAAPRYRDLSPDCPPVRVAQRDPAVPSRTPRS